jgi:hypothetical protein
MKIFESSQEALNQFEIAARMHGEKTEEGNYKAANKFYSQIVSAMEYLKLTNALPELEQFLENDSIGVRIWSARYLLPIKEKSASKCLRLIAESGNIHALTAETTLSEWRKGNLNF